MHILPRTGRLTALSLAALTLVSAAACGSQQTALTYATYHDDGNGSGVALEGTLQEEEGCVYFYSQGTKYLPYFPKDATEKTETGMNLAEGEATFGELCLACGGSLHEPQKHLDDAATPEACDTSLPVAKL